MEPGGRYPAQARAGGLAGRLPFGGRRGGGGPGGRGPGGRGPGRQRRKGDWWRHWTWKKAVGVVVAVGGACAVAGSVAVGVAYAQTTIPSMRQLVSQSDNASTVYYSNGKSVVGTFGQTKHVVLTYNQIPAVMREAAVAAEDKNFYHEGGVSVTGIIRAAYHDLLSSSSGNYQGASTITEQLVKQAYQGLSTQATNSATLSSGVNNKIKEILIAEKLAQEKSKAWVITEYLNSIYFGNGATGVGAASEAYFGIPASKLDTAQAAMLGAMIQLPGYYSPDPSAGAAYTALVNRWRTHVLATMVQMGNLSPQAAASMKFPKIVPQANNTWSGYRGYIMQRVQYELENVYHYTTQQIFTGGLKIYTTYNQHLMNSLYATVKQNKNWMRQCKPPSYALTGGGNAVLNGYACHKLPSYVHAGAVLIQPSTGDILAEYGGANYLKRKYDNAMESYNQVGSSFKPYVLAAALRNHMNAMNSIMNGYSPLWIPPVGSPPTVYPKQGSHSPAGTAGWYQVVNDEAVPSQGPVSVQKAMGMSLNTAFTSLYSRVGGTQVMDTAKAFGVFTGKGTTLWSNRTAVGEALGQGSLTVLEQATMIATIANQGTYVTPHAVAKIVQGNKTITAKVQHRVVLTPAQDAEEEWAMNQDTVIGGYGTAPGEGMNNGQVVIAKTGTTNLAQSGFFLGAIPHAAMAVGMFVNNPHCPTRLQKACNSKSSLSYAPPSGIQTLFGVGGLAGYGGGWPAAIWHAFMVKEYSNQPVQQWPTPPANLGQKWNLVGPVKKPKPKRTPKPKPTQHPQPGPTPSCNGNGHGHKCQPATVPPTPPPPTPSPTPTASPSPTASPTPCVPGTPGCTGGGTGGGGGGGTGGALPATASTTAYVVVDRPLPRPGLAIA